ncbi:hypothetical protein AJ79_08573 [Helicocarpus griseus UAMH5409]|uniref:Fungal lipase-type domain-containing protein n=1 Tax=Helicocarpus griseus UAMH5409 TaxID=1447875 RepID=A0A2B7WRU0_9EURO|nr:hypothetical protein AJ79_08573 [Helicocarpus griseus UAMH5409]
MKSLFLLFVSAFLHVICASALPEQRADLHDGAKCQDSRNVSKELFSSLEELSRIVDIAYCVGTTGVYKPFQCLGRCHEFPGFELLTTFNTGPLLSDSCGFLVLSHPPWPKRIIIGFRGTYSITNTIVDLSAIPQVYIPYPAPNPSDPSQHTCNNCSVHAGFMASWQSARITLVDPLKKALVKYPDYQLVLVGHSLGGAVAALAGLEFQVRGWQPQVTTFGEPMIGNEGLAEYFDEVFRLKDTSSSSPSFSASLNQGYTNDDILIHKGNKTSSYHRVTHINDPVPLLPLAEWGYKPHAGEIYISKSSVPPNTTDLRHCMGVADPMCIAGSNVTDKDLLLLSLSSSAAALDSIELWDSQVAAGDNAVNKEGGQDDTGQQRPLLISGIKNQPSMEEDSAQLNPVPHRLRLWELLFAHRNYFNHLGVCLPSPSWGNDPKGGKGGHGSWKWPWKWPWKWKWRWP